MTTSVVARRKTLQARILSGSIVLLSGSGLNTAINLAYNIAVARYLGPRGFGHATVIYTILVLLSEGFHRQPFVDLAVVFAPMSLVGSLLFARLMERNL